MSVPAGPTVAPIPGEMTPVKRALLEIRELRRRLADLESAGPFERVRRHLAGGTGRRRVSGLTATERALYLPYFVRAGQAPALVLVADNKAAESLHVDVLILNI